MFLVLRAIERKLRLKHKVSVAEVEQAALNRDRPVVRDIRSAEPRWWFVSETDSERKIKVVYKYLDDFVQPLLITAYEPSRLEEKIYEKAASSDDWPKTEGPRSKNLT